MVLLIENLSQTFTGKNNMDTNHENVIEKIRGRIGKKVRFSYPEGVKIGRLVDRAVIESGEGASGVPYWDIVDLIEFPGEPEKKMDSHWLLPQARAESGFRRADDHH
jgi:hypothetical protein